MVLSWRPLDMIWEPAVKALIPMIKPVMMPLIEGRAMTEWPEHFILQLSEERVNATSRVKEVVVS